jgi:plasmid maintenance system killer protein
VAFKSRLITFSILLAVTWQASAIDCNLMKQLGEPGLASNSKFWEEYSALTGSGKLSDRSLGELLSKHGSKAPSASTPKVPVAHREPTNYQTSRRADKEIAGLSASLRGHYEEFMNLATDKAGIRDLYANPGRWHMEKIKKFKDVYTVRLNGGVRVLFKMEKNDITVMEVNAGNIHNI